MPSYPRHIRRLGAATPDRQNGEEQGQSQLPGNQTSDRRLGFHRRRIGAHQRHRFFYCTTAGCFSPTLASRSWISRVSSSCRLSWIFVYSSVIRTVLWPAIFDVSMLDPPTSCRHVMLARRKE